MAPVLITAERPGSWWFLIINSDLIAARNTVVLPVVEYQRIDDKPRRMRTRDDNKNYPLRVGLCIVIACVVVGQGSNPVDYHTHSRVGFHGLDPQRGAAGNDIARVEGHITGDQADQFEG